MSEEPAANPYATPSAILEDEEPEEIAASGPKLASRWSRLAATVIDYLVVTSLPVLAYAYGPYRSNSPLDVSDPSSFDFGVILGMLFAVAMLLFNIFLLRYNGQTLGKKLMGIKLVRSDGYSYVSLPRIIGLRFLPVALVSRWIPVVGPAIWGVEALTIFGRERKCIHDYLADTIVITEDGADNAPDDVRTEVQDEREPAGDARASVEPEGTHLVVLASVDGPVDAAHAQALLEERQIPSRLDFDPITSNDPLLGTSTGGATLLVAPEHVDAAVDALSRGLEEADEALVDFDWDEAGWSDE